MRFVSVLVMALLLAGIGSAQNYMPEFTMEPGADLRMFEGNPGNIELFGGDINGSEYVDETDIDWTTMPIVNFNGSTGAELAACITANGGSKRYILQQPQIIVSSELNITADKIRIEGAAGTKLSTAINCTGSSGNGINITGYDCMLSNLYIYQSTSGLDNVIYYNRSEHHLQIINSRITVIDGTGILLGSSYRPVVRDCHITGPSDNGGVGIEIGDSGKSYSPIISRCRFDTLGTSIKMINTSGPEISDIYTYANAGGNNHVGILLSPSSDDSVQDVWIWDSIIDYGNGATGYSIYADGTYETLGLYMQNSYAWSQETDAIRLNNTEKVIIRNCYLASDAGYGIKMTSGDSTAPIIFSSNLILAHTGGIVVTGIDGGQIEGNYITLSGGTVGVELNSCTYFQICDNRCVSSNIKLGSESGTNYIQIQDNMVADIENYSGGANVTITDNMLSC